MQFFCLNHAFQGDGLRTACAATSKDRLNVSLSRLSSIRSESTASLPRLQPAELLSLERLVIRVRGKKMDRCAFCFFVFLFLYISSYFSGAPGDNFYNCQPGLSDILPASSLWVTAVGATQLGSKLKRAVPLNGASSQPYGAPICRSLLHPFGVKCADGSNRNEVACSYDTGALITTGGGFS